MKVFLKFLSVNWKPLSRAEDEPFGERCVKDTQCTKSRLIHNCFVLSGNAKKKHSPRAKLNIVSIKLH